MNHNKQNISLVIASLKKGDERVFKTIYEENKKSLSSFINTYTKNQAQTDDIVQDTFIKLWDFRESLAENNSVVSFLYKTAYNKFIDTYRKKKREQSMLDGWLYKRLILLKKDDENKKEKIRLVQEAIEKLPTKCKEIFMMSKFEQLKYVEIAERLDISIKTVEAQMGKAFSIIRKEAKNKGFFMFIFIKLKTLNKKA